MNTRYISKYIDTIIKFISKKQLTILRNIIITKQYYLQIRIHIHILNINKRYLSPLNKCFIYNIFFDLVYLFESFNILLDWQICKQGSVINFQQIQNKCVHHQQGVNNRQILMFKVSIENLYFTMLGKAFRLQIYLIPSQSLLTLALTFVECNHSYKLNSAYRKHHRTLEHSIKCSPCNMKIR